MGSKSLNVAMFTETFVPHANGVTTSILNARSALHRRGHKVTVYSAGPAVQGEDQVHYYGGKVFPLYPDFPVAIYPTRAGRENKRLLQKQGADLIHIHAPGPMGVRGYLAARRQKVPFLLTYHTVYAPLVRYAPFGWKTIYRVGSRTADYLLSSRCRFLIAPTHEVKRQLVRKHPELEPKIRVVPTGVDLERFRPGLDAARLRREWNLAPDDRVLLYLGRISFEKRIDVLLEAFARLQPHRPDLKLVLAGTGPALAAYQQEAQRLGIAAHVRFVGHVPDADVPLAYNAADVFASASTFETQGLTLVEAMGCGAPCAVAAAGGFLDVVRDGENGYLFAPGSVDGAVHAIELALAAPASLRERARASALPYGLEACIELLERVYEEALRAAEAEA